MTRRLLVWRWTDEPADEPRLLAYAIRLGVYVVALWLASAWVRGFDIHGWPSLVATAAIFGVVSALVKPIARLLGCPLIILTLGLFLLVINAAMLSLTGWIAGLLDLKVEVDGFWAAFLGALVVSLVSIVLYNTVERPALRALR